jgi:hypothetical protein
VPATGATVRVTSMTAAGRTIAVGGSWTDYPDVYGTTADQVHTQGISAAFGDLWPDVSGATQLRLLPSGSTTVPIVISQALADQTGLHVGSTTAMEGQVSGFQAHVVHSVPLVPGTTGEPALLGDLPTMVRGFLATSPQLPTALEAWNTSDDVDVDAFTEGRKATVQLPSTAIEGGFVGLVAGSLWLGAVGGAVFALLAVAATIATVQRRRRAEVVALRGLGMRASDQARVRIAEPAAAVVYALIGGAVVGVIASLLIVPSVARTSAPSAPPVLPVVPALDGWALVALLAGVVVCAGILLVVQYRHTRRAASGDGGAE